MARNGVLLLAFQAGARGKCTRSSQYDGTLIGDVTPQTVFVFLTIVSSGVQYLVQRMNYKRDVARVEDVISQARSAAWGNKLTPVEGQRKVRLGRYSFVSIRL